MKIKDLVRNIKMKISCNKDKHNYQYCTWGNGIVDNLDGTCGMWEIPTRTCNTCGKHEFKLKNGWELAKKGLTINDMQD